MSEGGSKKRKSKAWYRKQAYHNKRMKTDQKPGHRLTAGLKGFIVTCNERERDAVKESYNILNEYADKLYGPETKAEAESSGESDGEDIEAAIAREIQDLKDATAKGERRFQNSQTGAKNCIFIKTTLDDPVGLAHSIFTDLRQSKVQKSRHALRLLPVVGTCKASVKEISELAKDVLQPFFTETKLEVTFTVTFKARNNNGIGREMIISTLRQTVMDAFPSVLLRFTHVNPQITILVEVMCGVACIAVAKDFALFRKYNLVEVVHDKPERADSSDGIPSEKAAVTQGKESKEGNKTDSQQDAGETSSAKLDGVSTDGSILQKTAEEKDITSGSEAVSRQESLNTSSSISEPQNTAGTLSAQHVSEDFSDKVTDAGDAQAGGPAAPEIEASSPPGCETLTIEYATDTVSEELSGVTTQGDGGS